MWWVREFLGKNPVHRPQLWKGYRINGMEFSGLFVTNSPSFHIVPEDSQNLYFHDMEIYVDVMGQLELNKLLDDKLPVDTIKGPMDLTELIDMVADENGHQLTFPMFPLNTDGIDANGRNITFRRVKVTNFDDAIVAKPTNQAKTVTCTQDLLVEDCEVVFSVGMSIGSVPPSPHHSCLKDMTFRNVNFRYPLKAIYIKTNPGSGTGEIRNVLYENITIDTPIWWGIYIGPQQQK